MLQHSKLYAKLITVKQVEFSFFLAFDKGIVDRPYANYTPNLWAAFPKSVRCAVCYNCLGFMILLFCSQLGMVLSTEKHV